MSVIVIITGVAARAVLCNNPTYTTALMQMKGAYPDLQLAAEHAEAPPCFRRLITGYSTGAKNALCGSLLWRPGRVRAVSPPAFFGLSYFCVLLFYLSGTKTCRSHTRNNSGFGFYLSHFRELKTIGSLVAVGGISIFFPVR